MPLLTLPPDQIDDLIYSARAGDLEALQSDLSALSVQYSVPQAILIASAIDAEPEDEGGSGSSLLHFPAANGNLEILSHLLNILISANPPSSSNPASSNSSPTPSEISSILNHRNHSGNTPLHWAALNTHLECVKALVEAGADISIKNEAGLDAVFLAERADWSARPDDEVEEGKGQEEGDEEVEVTIGEGKDAAGAGPVSKGREVVEWLLAADAQDGGNES
ncbi:ankyrin repeat-containing domain protein [Aspergillus cavernicola]|uniref:Ankyrin repeat-containing domain protein n=1 Tax=Aspergillus cavernicola TaxID=176166 RepID=A0ABR4IB29_9EURO